MEKNEKKVLTTEMLCARIVYVVETTKQLNEWRGIEVVITRRS